VSLEAMQNPRAAVTRLIVSRAYGLVDGQYPRLYPFLLWITQR
jgi:hypothetical protein